MRGRPWEELTPAALPAGIWSFYLKSNGESHPLFLHLQIKLPSSHSWVGSSLDEMDETPSTSLFFWGPSLS